MPGFLEEEKKDFSVKNGFGCVFYFIDHSFCETGMFSFFYFLTMAQPMMCADCDAYLRCSAESIRQPQYLSVEKLGILQIIVRCFLFDKILPWRNSELETDFRFIFVRVQPGSLHP
jgi:hypothetical protein